MVRYTRDHRSRFMRALAQLLTLAVLLSAVLVFGAVPAGAASASLVVAPDPVVVHIGSAARVPFGTTVQVQIEAVDFVPAGNYFVSVAGAMSFRPTCHAVTTATACSVPIPFIPKGTYQMVTRYTPRYANSGSSVSVITMVIVAT